MYVPFWDWERNLWHYFYKDDGKIDNLYLGSSHVYYDINPALLDSMNGGYNFNLASSAQPLNGSYYLLKEAGKNNALSHVYLELYYQCSVKDNFHSGQNALEANYQLNLRNM